MSPHLREDPSITFIMDNPSLPFNGYFRSMIADFEKRTCKPTNRKLLAIQVHSKRFESVDWDDASSISVYKAGEWLFELICLIPIHIAVAWKNRFIPLKDGVFDTEAEKSLLGAEVFQIINAISLGWYESIFNSYMASKPVRVISSMGMWLSCM